MVRRLCRSEDFAKRASTDVKEDMAPLGRNHYSSLEDQQACNASALPWSTLQHGAGGGAGVGGKVCWCQNRWGYPDRRGSGRVLPFESVRRFFCSCNFVPCRVVLSRALGIVISV